MQSCKGQDSTGEFYPRLSSDLYTYMHTHLEKHVHCPVTLNTETKCHKQRRTTGDTGHTPVYINLLIFFLCTAYMIQDEKNIVESYFGRNGGYMCPWHPALKQADSTLRSENLREEGNVTIERLLLDTSYSVLTFWALSLVRQ